MYDLRQLHALVAHCISLHALPLAGICYVLLSRHGHTSVQFLQCSCVIPQLLGSVMLLLLVAVCVLPSRSDADFV